MAREIKVLFVADTKQFNAAIDESKRKLESAASGGAKQFNETRSAISASTVALAAFGVAGVAALKSIGSAAIDAALAIDKQVNSLKALTGSAEAAQRRFQELFKIAQASPGLTTNLAAQLDAQLRVFDVNVKTIDRLLPVIGKLNAIAPLGDPRQFVNNLTQLISQNFDRQDLKELVQNSPIAGNLIKQIFNVDNPTNAAAIREAAKNLGVTSVTRLAEEFVKAAETNPALQNATESLGTRFEKLQERVNLALAPIGDQLLRSILPALQDIVSAFEKIGPVIKSAFEDNQPVIRAMAATIGDLAKSTADLTVRIGGLNLKLDLFRNAIRSYLATLGLLSPGAAIGLGVSFERNLAQQDVEAAALRGSPFLTSPARDIINTAAVGGGGALAGGAASSAKRVAEQAKRLAEARKNSAEALDEFMKGNVEDLEAITRVINDANALGEERRRQIAERPAQLARHSAAIEARIRKDELETLRLEENTAKKAQEALKKNEELLSNNQRLMKGFAEATITVGDAFERFGRNVAFAFGNVRDLFNGLKQAVLGFFNDLVGGTLQSLVRSALGPIFGGLGGGRAAAGGGALSIFGFGQGFGVPGLGGGGGAGGAAGSILSGGKFNFGQLGESLLSSAPLLGLTFGGALGGKSIGGNILGAAGGLLTSTFLATTLGAPGALGSLAPALFSNPLTAIAGAGLLVGSVLLGKANQRKKDEEASGQMLTQALQGIEELAAGVASGRIDGGQARAVFENQILAQFIQGINSLKTKSVRESRLTNQVRDLRNVFESRIGPAIAAQQTRSANALAFSRQVPEFATGGTTLGGLAILHAGEKVVNLQQQSAMRAIGGPNIFEAAGVPGVNRTGIFDAGGTAPGGGGGGPTIVIEELVLDLDLGLSNGQAQTIAARGMDSSRGQAVIVKKIKDARRDKQL